MSDFASVKLTCTSSSLLLERVLQTARYRGFRVSNLEFSDQGNYTTIKMVVKGQAKLSTLEKSLMALVEVEECYLAEDQAELAPSVEMGQVSRPDVNRSPAQQLS